MISLLRSMKKSTINTKLTRIELTSRFLDHFGEIADLKFASIVHVHFKPHPASKALSDHISPITEIRTTYFSSDISESDQNDFAETFKQQVNKLNDSTDKATAAANGGWAVEEATIPRTSDKGKVYIGLIGWNSMEDHTSWTSGSDARDVEKLAEKFTKHVKHVDNVHFSGTQINAGPVGVGDIFGGAPTSVQEEILNPHDGSKKPPKTRSDGTTTKNNPDLKGAANALHKERQGE